MRKIMVTLVMAILLCFSFANAEGTSDYKRIKGSCAWYGCNNVSDSSGSWYCSSHMCSYSGCEHNKYCYTCDADAVTWNILGNFSFCGHSTYSSYCKNHACPKKGCSNDNSCPLHAKKCVITGCTYYVVDKINGKYASYCPTHKCAIEGCAYQKGGMLGTTAVGSLSQYCKTHTCDITKCKNPVSCQLDADGYPYKNGGNFICDTHTCSDSKCNNIVYCPTHKGSFDKCSTLSHSEGISVYCEKHRDTALTAGKDDATSTDGVDSTKNKVTQEELDAVIESIQNNPNIPEDQKTAMIEKVKQENVVSEESSGGAFAKCSKCGGSFDKCSEHGTLYCKNCDGQCPSCASVPSALPYKGLPDPSDFISDTALKSSVDTALSQSGITDAYALLIKIGFAVALIVLVIYGIQWIMATPQKKAELKQSIAPIVVAVFILAAGTGPAIILAQTILGFFENSGGAEGTIVSATQTAFSIIRTLGIALALLVVVVIGIQWVMGGPQKRAELKSKIGNILIGLTILLGAVTILSVLRALFK